MLTLSVIDIMFLELEFSHQRKGDRYEKETFHVTRQPIHYEEIHIWISNT